MTTILPFLLLWWSGATLALWFWKRPLFLRTWREPYFRDTPVLIESDDWGPGGSFHAERLERLVAMLEKHRDSAGRKPVFTADMVLAVPDVTAIKANGRYHRRYLDWDFPELYRALTDAAGKGILVPQLHGLEHLNSTAFMACYRSGDSHVAAAFEDDHWWDWESLDSPLQAHYVNGRQLPTTPEPSEKVEEIVRTALERFQQMFGAPSLSTVAPCYLWNGEVEKVWQAHGIRYIQTAGYRCTARNAEGRYIQDPPLLRLGDSGEGGQKYLVRNVMYEPVDGRNTPETAFRDARIARAQALPVTISTHRYNYTRSEPECRSSIEGLDALLGDIETRFPGVRYLSSPELGEVLRDPELPLRNVFDGSSWPPLRPLSGMDKVAPFFQRLRYRHPKLVIYVLVTGLIAPVLFLAALSSLHHRLKENTA